MEEKLIVLSFEGNIIGSFMGTMSDLRSLAIYDGLEVVNCMEFCGFLFVEVKPL